jgi:hypothetical protein
MKYFYDCEFIDTGKTLDLISIGIVSEDNRELYAINIDIDLTKVTPWIHDNVFPYLFEPSSSDTTKCILSQISTIRKYLLDFCDIKKYGKPEFWGYYSSYDHVMLCQIFGKMIDLPVGWSRHTNDIKQLCNLLGNPNLLKYNGNKHNALFDARWNKLAFEFLDELC